MYTYYVGEYNFSQTDSDNPLLFIGKYLLNQVDGDSHAKEDNKTSVVHNYMHTHICIYVATWDSLFTLYMVSM